MGSWGQSHSIVVFRCYENSGQLWLRQENLYLVLVRVLRSSMAVSEELSRVYGG